MRALDAVDAGTVYAAGATGGIYKRTPTGSATDYGAAPNTWGGNPAANLFGMCVQDLALNANADAGFTEDNGGLTPNACNAVDTDPWRDVPAASTKVAHTLSAGQAGRVDLVWGFRASSSQPKGTYRATVLFEVLAPG
jgi:hypothetical protein